MLLAPGERPSSSAGVADGVAGGGSDGVADGAAGGGSDGVRGSAHALALNSIDVSAAAPTSPLDEMILRIFLGSECRRNHCTVTTCFQ